MTQRVFAAAMLLLLAASVVAGALRPAAQEPAADPVETLSAEAYYAAYGRLVGDYLRSGDDSLALTARSFNITERELTCLTGEYMLGGMDEAAARTAAENQLVEKYTLYHLALRDGVEPDEAGVRENLEYNRALSKESSNNAEFLLFLDAAGLTHDEYWDSQYENFLMLDVIARYQAQLHDAFVGEHASDDAAEREAQWTAYFEKLCNEAVLAENVTVRTGK